MLIFRTVIFIVIIDKSFKTRECHVSLVLIVYKQFILIVYIYSLHYKHA